MTASRVVLITAPIVEHSQDRLHRLSSDLQIERWDTRSGTTIPDSLRQVVEIIYASIATRLPATEQAPQLRWVQLYSASPDSILDQPLFASNVIFTTTSGVH